ncbi:MAG: DUF5615 family PIN-like protein [Hyphomonadaceae bacterium]|nr:DUF5615 family PIN-like protein [Hyphomonadaceae bacterium]
MNFVIDQQLPPALVDWLIGKGHQAAHVYFLGLGEAEDADIWAYAQANAAIIVTKDPDFAERRSRVSAGPTILWLRSGNSTTPTLLAIMDGAWPSVEPSLVGGAVVEVR